MKQTDDRIEVSDRISELTRLSEQHAQTALAWALKLQTEPLTPGEYCHASLEMNKHFRLADQLLHRAELLCG